MHQVDHGGIKLLIFRRLSGNRGQGTEPLVPSRRCGQICVSITTSSVREQLRHTDIPKTSRRTCSHHPPSLTSTAANSSPTLNSPLRLSPHFSRFSSFLLTPSKFVSLSEPEEKESSRFIWSLLNSLGPSSVKRRS